MPTSTNERRYMTTREAADVLGVSTATVYRMLDAGELDYVKVRSLYRIPRAALEQDPGGFVATGGNNTPETAE
jgi:excisionase family DNA binding protein